MSSEQWLDEVGREYLAQLQAVEPQFLIEIDVPDPKLKDIFTNLAKVAPYRWTPEKSICLALASASSAVVCTV